MAFTPQQLREHRKKLKAKGVCVRCHKEKTNGFDVCDTCREKQNKRREELIKNNLCVSCMRPLDDVTLTRCVNCKEMNTWYTYKSREYARMR